MKIIASNPSIDTLEQSYLLFPYQSGVNSIKVNNNDRFSNGQKIMIGRMGSERTEIVTVNGATTPGNALPTTPTLFAHNADDPVYALKYDKMRVYRSVNGIDGAYDFLAIVDIDVDNASLSTVYDDLNGLTSYFYKVAYYDSVGAIESELSDIITGTGYPRGTVGKLVNEFFEEVGDQTQQHMSVEEAIADMNEVNDDIITQSRRPYRWLSSSKTLDLDAGQSRIPFPADLWKVDRISYGYDDGIYEHSDLYRIVTMEELEYLSANDVMATGDYMQYVALDEVNNEIVVYPTVNVTRLQALTVYYYSNFKELKGMADTFQTPNPRIYKLFLLGKYYRKRATKEPSFVGLSDRYFNDYTGEIVKLQRTNRLDIGSPMGMRPDTRKSRGLRRF